jgi:Sulfotransferase family
MRRGAARPDSAEGRRFVFVGGAPRSGTTLMQNMLNSHPGVFGGPEFLHLARIVALRNALRTSAEDEAIDAFVSPARVDRLIRGLIEEMLLPLADRHGAPLLSEKTPSNALVFDDLLALFPQARCIFVLRDPRAVVASMLAVGDRAAAAGTRTQPFTRSLRAAVRYVRECLEAAFAAEAAHPGRILTVIYEALVTEPEAATRRVCGFLGLDWDAAMLAPGAAEHLGMKAITAGDLWYDAASFRRDPDPSGLHRWRERLGPFQAARVAAAFADLAPLAAAAARR